MTQVISGNDFEADVLKTDGVFLVDFYADWCGPCQALAPTLDEVEAEIGKKAIIYKVNVDDDSELASQYGVMSIPAIKVFKNGEVVDETTGAKSKEELIELIDKHQ